MDVPSKISDSPPPPYEGACLRIAPSLESSANESDFIHTVSRSDQSALRHPSCAEVERMRRFLLYVLKVDYKVDPDAKLEKGDWHYFTQLSQSLHKLSYSKLPNTTNGDQEVLDIVDEYRCKHVHAPARELGVPGLFAETMVANWIHSLTTSGRSHSMLKDSLDHGSKAFAARLYVDREIMIPALVASKDSELKRKLLEAVQEKIDGWFQHFESPDCFVVKTCNAQAVADLPKRLALVRSLQPSFLRRPISEIIATLKVKSKKYNSGKSVEQTPNTSTNPFVLSEQFTSRPPIRSHRLLECLPDVKQAEEQSYLEAAIGASILRKL